ncbi:MAG: tetrahydromethanopterin S-methyltransferase subunit G [Methanimicrococcus sp.]|nr:tetrahydromethanopterin S-methyltransferase subunit G [Methanimicrococcus sp.]
MQDDMKINFRGGNESAISAYEEITERLDRLDEKVEFVRSEVAQRTGQKIGRDVGILYGIIATVVLFLLYLFVKFNGFTIIGIGH